MATYTLTGDLEDACRVQLPDATTTAYLIPLGVQVEGTGVQLASVKLTLSNGVFTQANIAPGEYEVRVLFYDPGLGKQVRRSWRIGIGSSGDLRDFIVASTYNPTDVLHVGSVTSGTTPSVTLNADGSLDFVLKTGADGAPGSPATTLVDNGDGTATLGSPTIVDNGDGTATVG